MGDIYNLRDWRVGIAKMGDFNNTTLAATASTQIPTGVDAEIKRNVVKRHPNRTNKSRVKNQIDHTISDKNIAPTFTWNSIATKEHVDFLLAGLFQRVDEEATTPYQKAFTWPNPTAVWGSSTFGYPTFADDEGYYFGFLVENPTSGNYDEGILSCVPTSATFSIDSTSDDSRLQFTSDWMGRLVQDGVAYTAPTAYTSLTGYEFQDMTVTLESTAVTCYGWSLTINPGFKQIPGRGASCQDIAMGDGMHRITGYVDLLWDTITRLVFADIGDDGSGGQTLTFKATWGSTGADGYLNFEFPVQFDDISNQGTEERIRRLSFEFVPAAGSDATLVEMANAIDRVWQS